MTYAENLWLFSLLLAGIIVVPGMDMIFVIANGLTGGRRAGIAATSGIMLGGAFHTLFGTIAVTALSTLVPQLAGPMLVIGSGYMIWIGYTLARSAIVIDGIEASKLHRTARIFSQGLITCLLNPKAWLACVAGARQSPVAAVARMAEPDILTRAAVEQHLHAFDLDMVREFRRSWGLFRDRRPELYGALATMDGSRTSGRGG